MRHSPHTRSSRVLLVLRVLRICLVLFSQWHHQQYLLPPPPPPPPFPAPHLPLTLALRRCEQFLEISSESLLLLISFILLHFRGHSSHFLRDICLPLRRLICVCACVCVCVRQSKRDLLMCVKRNVLTCVKRDPLMYLTRDLLMCVKRDLRMLAYF
jgi:hypothetical protein